MHSTGAMRMPAAGLEGKMDIKAMSPNLMYMNMEIPGVGAIKGGFDGTTGWATNPMAGPTIIEGSALEDFRRQADMHRDLRLAMEPGKSEVIGLATFGPKTVWSVQVREGNGREYINLYEKDGGLLCGSIMKVATQMGELPVTSVIGQYKDFGDVKVSTNITAWSPVGAQEITTDTCTWNTMTAKDFAAPPEIAALVAEKAKPVTPAAPPQGK